MTFEIDSKRMRVAFIGSAGIPNRYGGFEAFLEHCAPSIARQVERVVVTCDARMYEDHTTDFEGVERRFIGVPANGVWSIIHDLVAFLAVWPGNTHIVVLGVSGGIWFPFFRALCALGGRRLLVNIDGVEWRRTKFSVSRRILLRLFDALAQVCAHTVIYDNAALAPHILARRPQRKAQIAYSGDHVLRLPGQCREPGTALTICRIEPENNIDMLIEGALASPLALYTIVGNWAYSDYGRSLKARHEANERLQLLDPIYDPQRLAQLRERCAVYIHGHSVGGTNPSLVEMLFYDCRILCLDVPFHHETAGACASYFASGRQLAAQLAEPDDSHADRAGLRAAYSREAIARQYIEAMRA